MERGKYIVIEGADGTGKTTQADLLQDYLKAHGKQVIHLKEPGGSPIAEAIRTVILDGTLERSPMTNILLFTANRHELWHAKIKPALEQGIWVISTRNYWSTLVYQGYGEGMNSAIITAITNTFTESGYMHPDAAVILTVNDLATSHRRIQKRGPLEKPDPFESQSEVFQERIRQGYLHVAEHYGLPIINAEQSPETVSGQIITRLKLTVSS